MGVGTQLFMFQFKETEYDKGWESYSRKYRKMKKLINFKPGKMTFGISLVISGGNSFRSNTGTDKGLSLSALK
jgi:hypothetical protein